MENTVLFLLKHSEECVHLTISYKVQLVYSILKVCTDPLNWTQFMI